VPGASLTVTHSLTSFLRATQRGLCGLSRPTHFQGVATVVCKLFNIVRPDVAVRQPTCGGSRIAHLSSDRAPRSACLVQSPPTQVFGRKDYQQFKVLSRMVRDLDFGITMIGAPLVREADGLALSSRNVRLTPENRSAAVCISRALRSAAEQCAGGAGDSDAGALRSRIVAAITEAGGVVDYVEIVAQDTLAPVASVGDVPAVMLVAAKFGAVRLLDNWELTAIRK
jgi:pantoate--beta-alanine ligase